MIPKLHAKGSSFRGAAAYLLHDVGSETTSDRVAWVETRNLPVAAGLDDLRRGEIAWRLMAATALDQTRIKERAWEQAQEALPEAERKPFRNTGRKSRDHVLHLTLSWAEHEADSLTKDDMLEAVDSVLAALGEEPGKKGGGTRANGKKAKARQALRRQFADEHQAMIVGHSDTHPHVHILLNRVHPEHGVMLPTSKEHLLLSRWAQAYEEARGEVLVEQRRENNRRRDQGDHWSLGSKDRPRHLYELEAANDNQDLAEKVRAEQKAKDYRLARVSRAVRQLIRKRWKELEEAEAEKRREIRAEAQAGLRKARSTVRDQFAPRFTELELELDAERVAFARAEDSFSGRVLNAIRQVDWRGLFTSRRRSTAMKEAFTIVAGGHVARADALRKRQEARWVALLGEQRRALRALTGPIRAKLRERLKLARGWYFKEHVLVQAQATKREEQMKRLWKKRRARRAVVWEAVPKVQRERTLGERGCQTTRPDRAIQEAVEQHKDRMRKSRERDRGRGRDDDWSR